MKIIFINMQKSSLRKSKTWLRREKIQETAQEEVQKFFLK